MASVSPSVLCYLFHQGATQKATDSDSMMSPDLSPFGPPMDSFEERRRSQALMGVGDVEANLSEEKLLQVDLTDGGKVSGERSDLISFIFSAKLYFTLPSSSSRSTHSSPAPFPQGRGEAVRSPPSSTSD